MIYQASLALLLMVFAFTVNSADDQWKTEILDKMENLQLEFTQRMGDLSEFKKKFRKVYTSNLDIWTDSSDGKSFIEFVKNDKLQKNPAKKYTEIEKITKVLKMPYPLCKEDFQEHLENYYEFIYCEKNDAIDALRTVYLNDDSPLRLPPRKLTVIVENKFHPTMKRIAGEYIFETGTYFGGIASYFGSWLNEETGARIIPSGGDNWKFRIQYDESLTRFTEDINGNMNQKCVDCDKEPSNLAFHGYNRLCLECTQNHDYHCRNCFSQKGLKKCTKCDQKVSTPILKNIELGVYSENIGKAYCPPLNKDITHKENNEQLRFHIEAGEYKIKIGMRLLHWNKENGTLSIEKRKEQ